MNCTRHIKLRLIPYSSVLCGRTKFSLSTKFSNKSIEPTTPNSPHSNTSQIRKPPRSKIPFVNWFRDDFLKGKIKYNAFQLYAEMTNQINYLKFFKLFKMEDTFNSWFLVTELHVWMLLTRLKPEGKDGKIASGSLVTALWDDSTSRAKVLSPGDSSTSKKQIVTLAEEFRASLLIYDEGLLSSDTVLASALWYRFLTMSCDDPRLIELLVAYVRQQVYNLDNASAEDIIMKAKLTWHPLELRI